MSLLTQPLISYAELTVPPPCHRTLWEANTALQWKSVYLQQSRNGDRMSHSRRPFLEETDHIFHNRDILDVDASILLATTMVWPQLWQYHEMVTSVKHSRKGDERHTSLVVTSRRQELTQMLEHIRMTAREWHFDLVPATRLLHEQCSMHLCVSLEDVQLLAGKEGEEEARRIFPSMRAWANSTEARQGLYHAGQIVRVAKRYPKFMLRDASAIAVYHASLTFWAYAVTSKSEVASSLESASTGASCAGPPDLVRLDGEDGPEVRRFLLLGRGLPCIQDEVQTGDNSATCEVPLNEPEDLMGTITRILQRNHEGGGKSNPPLIGNLSVLMHSLGTACLARKSR